MMEKNGEMEYLLFTIGVLIIFLRHKAALLSANLPEEKKETDYTVSGLLSYR